MPQKTDELWTFSKPITVSMKRPDGSTFNMSAKTIRVVETIGYPEHGMQRAMVNGAVSVDSEINEVWDLDSQKPGNALGYEIAVRNILSRARVQ